MPVDAPLHGIRIIECSVLGPAAITCPWSTSAPR